MPVTHWLQTITALLTCLVLTPLYMTFHFTSPCLPSTRPKYIYMHITFICIVCQGFDVMPAGLVNAHEHGHSQALLSGSPALALSFLFSYNNSYINYCLQCSL